MSMKAAVMMFKDGVSPRLDIADSLVIYDVDAKAGIAARDEKCSVDFEQPFQLISFLQKKGISTVLCGGCPQFFWRMLFYYGFEVVSGVMGDPEELMKLLAAGKLPGMSSPSHGYMEGCCGRRGRFRWRVQKKRGS